MSTMPFFCENKIKVTKFATFLFVFIAVFFVARGASAASVYYSVGQNTTDHSSGGNVSITVGVATFTVAQSATNLGVGDKLIAGGNTYYLASKTSTTVWNVVTNLGAVPSDLGSTAVTSIAHVFNSLSVAEAGAVGAAYLNTSDLVAGNYQLNFPCYYDTGADTTLVVIDGYTTSESNNIRIYTPSNTTSEVNQSQRHSGKWDDGKYRMQASGSVINLNDDYVWIDGIQINNTANDWGVSISNNGTGASGMARIKVSNNIIKYNNPVGGNNRGMDIRGATAGSIAYIWNNILYGFGATGSTGINMVDTEFTYYVYNNTIQTEASSASYAMNTGNLTVAKNNIIKGFGNYAYSGTFLSGTDYNSTDGSDNIGQGSNNRINQVFQFVDAANKDFHLSPTDTAAKNAGVDLSADANLPFSTDIDGQNRHAGSWDIGADETTHGVYFSVGQNTSSHETGAGNVTVSGTTATFTVAQTATNMGVGDVINYDTDNKICYISGKTSQTVWNCTNVTGGTPVAANNVVVNSISHVFGSLSAALPSGAGGAKTLLGNADLTAINVQLNVPCYYDSGADTVAVTINGWTTDATRYVKVYTPNNISTEVNVSHRHNGKWDVGKYSLAIASYNASMSIYDEFVRVEGLQISSANSSDSSSLGGIGTDIHGGIDGEVQISNNIIRNIGSGRYYRGINLYLNSGSVAKIWNNVVYNFFRGIRISNDSPGEFDIYNNTVLDIQSGGSGIDVYTGIPVGVLRLKNNLINGSATNYSLFGTGNFATYEHVNNLSQDATSPDNVFDNKTVSFIDAPNKDFHLASTDTAAKNSGADLSADANLSITNDIDAQTRSGSWDIGADEGANNVFYSVGQSASDLKTGTPTVTIASGTATFSTAQTGNIGVGDRVMYNTSSIAYIASKIDQSNWKLVTATGGVPADIAGSTVVSIKHEYTSLSAAVASASDANHINNTNLTAANVVLNLPCYYDSGADTTAFTISGYTTSAPNYIKIYTPFNALTEANNSQRHAGKWDDGKYRMAIGSSFNYILDDFVRVEGLQVYTTSGVSLYYTVNPPVGEFRAVGNILKGSVSDGIGILYAFGGGGKAIIANNIIYDMGSSWGGINTNGGPAYIYNNTVTNSNTGISVSDGSTYAINNIVQNCSNGFHGNFNVASNYNISDLASDVPGANSKNGAHVKFVDAANKDFHLAADDTAAIGAGVNLFADTNLPVTTDIDGNPRPSSGAFDIGADQTPAKIFYSVGQNTNDHSIGNSGATCSTTGACTVSIANGTATFSHAQTAANLGVGDRVTYNTNSVAYISEKITQTDWKLITATGGRPADVTTQTLNSITHAFASLSLAEAGAPALLGTSDLVAANVQLNFPCYYDTGADTTAVTVDGYTTSVGSYIKIYTPNDITNEVNVSQRHSGKWDDGKYSLQSNPNNSFSLWVSVPYIWIDGMQARKTGTAYGAISFGSASGNIKLSNSIIRGFGNMHSVDVVCSGLNYVWNNIIYGNDIGSGLRMNKTGAVLYVYNNSVHGMQYGVYNSLGSIIAKNNIVQGSSEGFHGAFDASSDYNISNLTSDAPGVNSKNLVAVSFVDAANFDFHLLNTDTIARDAGVDLLNDTSLSIKDDVDGQLRSQGGTFDIGADETGATTKINGGVKIDGGVRIKKY